MCSYLIINMAEKRTNKIINCIMDDRDVCGGCLCKSENLETLDTIYVIGDKTHTLSGIMTSVYGYIVDNQLATQSLCGTCISTILKAYLFIRNIKRTSGILERMFEQIEAKVQNCSSEDHIINIPHIETITDSYECSFCSETFKKHKAIMSHVKAHKDNAFRCKNCLLTFDKLQSLVIHRKQEHLERIYHCSICNIIFLKNIKKRHYTKYHNNSLYICNYCKKMLYNKASLKMHIHKHFNNKLICDICFKTFKNKENLFTHECLMKERKKNKAEKEEDSKLWSWEYKCGNCNANRIRKYDELPLKRHINQIDKRLKKGSTCDVHDGTSLNEGLITNHRETHKDHRQRFDCGQYVNAQIKSRINKNFRCEKCDYSSKFSDCLEAHVNRYHLHERPYKCDICEKQFYARSTLKEHVRTHLQLKPEQCDVCGHRFVNKKALKVHVRLHTGEKPYPCDLCSEKFLSASRRQAHRIRKHFDPAFQCDICLKMYYTRSAVKIHKRDFHSGKKKVARGKGPLHNKKQG